MPEQIISTTEDQNRPVNWVERRATVRYPFHQPALWRANHSQGSVCLWGLVRDISLEGIGLVLKRGLPPKTILIVELENASHQKTFTLETQVVHSTLQPDGTWRTGCRLRNRLTEQELQTILS
jgi:PilZ domain